MDRQNLETVFMLPTFACGSRRRFKHDIEATMASIHAFNPSGWTRTGFRPADHRVIAAPDHLLVDPDSPPGFDCVVAGAKIAGPAVRRRVSSAPLARRRSAARSGMGTTAEAGAGRLHLSDSGYSDPRNVGGKSTFEGLAT